jgi:hypothetical protein
MLSFSIAAFADTIRLKDGSIIKGRITGFSGGVFTVTIGEGPRQRTMTFNAAEVESIEFDAVPPFASNPATTERPSTPPRVVISDTTAAPNRQDPPRVVTSSEPSVAPRPQPEPIRPTPASTAQPIEINIKVLADNTSNGWTNSGWVVRKGQRIRIVGDGEVSLGRGNTTGPSGRYDIEDADKLMPAVPTGALIAVIGDDNNDFIYIGTSREFVAVRDGALFLGLNEGYLDDNSGAFEVRVEIMP